MGCLGYSITHDHGVARIDNVGGRAPSFEADPVGET